MKNKPTITFAFRTLKNKIIMSNNWGSNMNKAYEQVLLKLMLWLSIVAIIRCEIIDVIFL